MALRTIAAGGAAARMVNMQVPGAAAALAAALLHARPRRTCTRDFLQQQLEDEFMM
jgi:hypothetical protein